MPESPVERRATRIRVFCESLVGRASPQAERAYGASFDVRVRDTIDLMEHNEAVVGLENLLDNLADFGINLSAGERVALEGFMAAFGVEIGSPLRYQVIHWDHDLPDEPTLLYSEIGVDGVEVRKVEECRSGLKDFASAGVRSGDSHLSEEPIPPIAEIAADPQFSGHSLTRSEFEAVWSAATTDPVVQRY